LLFPKNEVFYPSPQNSVLGDKFFKFGARQGARDKFEKKILPCPQI